MSVEVLNFGCRLNIAEGSAIARLLDGQHDMTVINGCAVTGEAMRQTAKAVGRTRHSRPDARIVVSGCAGQLDPARFAAMPEVDLVLGNREKMRADAYLHRGVHVGDIMQPATARLLAISGEAQTRAFVEVQTGCDHRCTFCVIPFARGNSVSVPITEVVDEIARAVERGQREVVLTGVDLTSFRPSLAILVAAILRSVPTLSRLRLSSLDPAEIDDALIDLIAHEPRVMPHVHLSLQSGDAMILKRMKRRHTPDQAIALVTRLKSERPDIAVGADLIAGFPTETDAMHRNSLASISTCDLVFGHVFPYSPRGGTPGARMPQVVPELAKQRATELRNAVADRQAAWLTSLIGTTQDVLVERSGTRGHASNFATVDLELPAMPGTIVAVRATAAVGDRLVGCPA